MSPANPTGVMMSAASLAALADACDRLGLWFISDEIYHGLTYEAPATPRSPGFPEAIIVNSFSKYFCMTGWRIGWLILPQRLVRPVERAAPYVSQVERLAQNLFISPPRSMAASTSMGMCRASPMIRSSSAAARSTRRGWRLRGVDFRRETPTPDRPKATPAKIALTRPRRLCVSKMPETRFFSTSGALRRHAPR